MEPSWYCHWCGDIAGPQSALQPAYCTTCVTSILQGAGAERRAIDPERRAAWLAKQAQIRAVAIRLGLVDTEVSS